MLASRGFSMAAGDSILEIVNIGLAALGEDPITDIDAPYKRAIGMKGAYDRVRRATLEAHPWRFAKKMDNLSSSASSPAPEGFGYANAFDLPADFIRPFDKKDDNQNDWEVVGNQILSDAGAPLRLVYIYDHADPTKYPPLFCKVLGLELALDQCVFITGSTERLTTVRQLRADALPDARTVSAQSASPRELDGDILLRSRD